MRCHDDDVMLMQKEKQAKSNLGKTPGHYSYCSKIDFAADIVGVVVAKKNCKIVANYMTVVAKLSCLL